MKNIRTLAQRTLVAALMATVAAAALAQDFGGPGGPPPGGPGQGRMGGRMGGPQRIDRLPPLAMLATRPEVADELDLSEEQRARVEEIVQALRPQGGPGRGGPGQGFGPGGPGGGRGQGGPRQGGFGPGGFGQGGRGQDGPPDRAEREKAEEAADAKVRAVLSRSQAKRIAEIQVQTMGLSAAMVPAVQSRLGLSDDQKARLRALVPARGPEGPGGRGQGGPGGPPPDGDDRGFGGPPPDQGGFDGPGQGGRGQGGPNDGRRRELEAKIAAILTQGQKSALKAMGGKPIDLRQGPRE